MIPRDVEQFTERLRKGEGTGKDRVRHTSTPFWLPPSPANGAIAELLMPTLSSPETLARLAELERGARTDRGKERRRLHDQVTKASTQAKKDVVALTHGRLRAAEALVKLPPIFGAPEYHLLTTPYLIWPTTIVLDSSEIIDKNSFANFRVIVDPDSEFYGFVRFMYYWTNPYDEEALIDLDVLCTWNGYNDVTVDGGLLSSNRNNTAVDASLDVNALWDPTLVVGDIWNIFVATLSSNTSIYSLDHEISAAVHSGVDLRVAGIHIPPLKTVVFSARVSVDCQVIGAGSGNFDYSSGDFQVASPYALVTVLARYTKIGTSL